MAIREDVVASAAQFLQDPNVASSSIENRVSFLRSKNLTQEEIDVAMARAGGGPTPSSVSYPTGSSGPPQQYYPSYPAHAWQPPPPVPRRDWRDWFIMATVVGGVSYGLYSLGKRYVYPLVAPPTPERLEQDKKSIEEQFDKAFALVDQLSKDTEKLKEAEQQRTEKLDAAISELETVMSDLKTSNRRREDDAQRIREEVRSLKDAIPKAMENQKSATDARLREINTELTSLKTLVSQRMTAASSPSPAGGYIRPGSAAAGIPGNRVGTPAAETAAAGNSNEGSESAKPQTQGSSGGRPWESANGGSSPKASIPAWQLAMANKAKEGGSSSRAATVEAEEPSSSQQEAGGSSSSA
ncbi:hypothetical protein S40288_07892 [Stachybotrys chartarum IBT 40288]|nr:hypothetical protein S40288_07892 [Stachybotrys chartarum IBT 40288]